MNQKALKDQVGKDLMFPIKADFKQKKLINYWEAYESGHNRLDYIN